MQKTVLFLKRKQHTSIFVAFICVGILLGVAYVVLPNGAPVYGLGWFIFAILLLVFCFWKRTTWLLSFAIVSGMLIGITRAAPVYQQVAEYEAVMGSVTDATGIVSEDVAIGKRDDKQLKITNVTINGRSFSGTVWISTNSHLNLKRGYEITANGKINDGFGSFSASIYNAKIIEAKDTHKDRAREIRDWFSDSIRVAIPEPEASLGIGYLVGQKSSLPENLQEQLKIVGLTHIVVASGYNLTILVRFTRRIFSKISKYLAALTGSLMIAGFMLVTGFSPSMSRAGLVAGLSLAAWYYGRKIHPLVLLPFAAAVTVIINPSFMWGDLGWYLSFAAFAGVMVFAPLFQDYFFGPKKPGTLRQILGETISAQLTTLPIIAMSFGVVAVFALPANVLVLPFVPIAMFLTFGAGVVALIFPTAALIVGVPAYLLLRYMTTIVDVFANIPNANIEVSLDVVGLVILYTLLIMAGIYMQRSTKHNFKEDNIVE